MSNSKTQKAIRATVEIGSTAINVYQLPDGSYRLAGRNVTDAVAEHNSSLKRFYGVKTLKALPSNGLSLKQIKAETGESFVPIALEDAVKYWVGMTAKGSRLAEALVTALASETLERRADRVFGVQRQEEEYIAATNMRFARLMARRQWTDVVKTYQQQQGIYGTSEGQQQFVELTRYVNIKMFGVPHFNCDRDNMTPEQQDQIQQVERAMRMQFDRTGTRRPLKAIIDSALILAGVDL